MMEANTFVSSSMTDLDESLENTAAWEHQNTQWALKFFQQKTLSQQIGWFEALPVQIHQLTPGLDSLLNNLGEGAALERQLQAVAKHISSCHNMLERAQDVLAWACADGQIVFLESICDAMDMSVARLMHEMEALHVQLDKHVERLQQRFCNYNHLLSPVHGHGVYLK